MKKLIILAVLLIAGVVYAGYYFAPQTMPAVLKPERRACSRLTTLCGAQGGQDSDQKQCVDAMGDLRTQLGDEAVRQPMKCMMEAGSCAEGLGCMGGAGVKAAMKGVGDFFKGVGKALNE